jgi:hypothetical protein
VPEQAIGRDYNLIIKNPQHITAHIIVPWIVSSQELVKSLIKLYNGFAYTDKIVADAVEQLICDVCRKKN